MSLALHQSVSESKESQKDVVSTGVSIRFQRRVVTTPASDSLGNFFDESIARVALLETTTTKNTTKGECLVKI